MHFRGEEAFRGNEDFLMVACQCGDRPGGETQFGIETSFSALVTTDSCRPLGHLPRLEQLPALCGRATGLWGPPTPEQVSVGQRLVSCTYLGICLLLFPE